MQCMALCNIELSSLPFIRAHGPYISAAVNMTEVVQNVDLLPTWLRLVQARGLIDPKQRDGKSSPLFHSSGKHATIKVNQFRSVALAEM